MVFLPRDFKDVIVDLDLDKLFIQWPSKSAVTPLIYEIDFDLVKHGYKVASKIDDDTLNLRNRC